MLYVGVCKKCNVSKAIGDVNPNFSCPKCGGLMEIRPLMLVPRYIFDVVNKIKNLFSK